MNLLFLNWKDVKNPEVGGAEIIVHEFARRLVREGHHVTWFTRSYSGGKKSEVIDGITIVRRGGKYSVYYQAFQYYRSLKRKPDLVFDLINTIAWLTPLYVPEGQRVAYLNQLAKEVWRYEYSLPLAFIGKVTERLQYLLYKNTPFLCYSESTSQDLQSMGIPKSHIGQFRMGLDHKRYIAGGQKSKDPLFIFVARLVSYKRADLCIAAMQIVAKKYPKAQLAIIGNGPEEKRLQEMISSLQLEENCSLVNKNNFYLEKTKGDNKLHLMQTAWAHILPSVKEGWGMVVTESAACGTPSIVTDVSGLRDSVIKNKTGLIIPSDPTPKRLAEAMVKIIEDRQLRKRLGEEAVAFAKTFTWAESYNGFKRAFLQYAKQ